MSTGYFISSAFGAAATGAVSAVSAERENEAVSFMPDASTKMVGMQALDGAVSSVDQSLSSGNPSAVVSNVTGVNHRDNSVMNTNVGGLKQGSNAGSNVAQGAKAETSLQECDKAIGGFEDHLNDTQNMVADTVGACAADQSVSKGAAAKSFGVGSERTIASAGAALAGGAALGGVSAIYDLRRMASDNLSPDAEAKLAVQIAQTLIQHDIDSGGPPQFNHEFLESQTPQELVQTFKELMRSANMHEEHKEMMALKSALEDVVSDYRRDADLNEMVASADVDSADVAVDDLDNEALERVSACGVACSELPPGGLIAQNDSIFDLNVDNDAISAAINARQKPIAEYEIALPKPIEIGAAA